MSTKIRFVDVQDSEFASQAELDAIAGFNYITNPRAEVDTSGWSNSGSNFTVSRTTTSGEILMNIASFKLSANGSQAVDDYIYIPFTIGLGDTNRTLNIQFYYKGLTGYNSGDVEFVIWDGTSEIVPSLTVIPGGLGLMEVTWESNSAVSYQLRFKAKVTTSFSLSVDNVQISNRDLITSMAAGYWGSYTPSITATTNPAKGVTGRDIAHVWRRGKFAFIIYDYVQTSNSGASGGSGYYRYSMPPGLTIDGDYTPLQSVTGISLSGNLGQGYINDGAVSAMYTLQAFGYDVDHFSFHSDVGVGDDVGSTVFSLANNNLRLSVQMLIPITEWDEQTILSNNKVEYASNSSTNDGNDTNSFAWGSRGSLVPPVTDSIYKKRVRFKTPILPTDEIQARIDVDGVGKFADWEDHGYDDSIGKMGVDWTYVPGSDYEIDVWMRGGHYARITPDTVTYRTFSQEYSAGSRWHIRKSSNALAVESPYRESAISDWEPYDLTIGSTATPPIEGTGTKFKRAMWRRVGDSMDILFEYRHSVAGTTNSGTYLFPLPAGHTADTDKITTSSSTGLTYYGITGSGWASDNAGNIYPVTPVLYDANNIKLLSTDFSYSGYEVGASFITMGNTDVRYFFIVRGIPIVGWASNIVLEPNKIEYAYNSDETDAHNTTDFAYGKEGALVPPVTSTLKYKDVEFLNEPKPGEYVDLWVKIKNRKWQPVGGTYMHWHEYASALRGVYMAPLSGSPRRYRVYFNSNGAGYSQEDGQVNSWGDENSAGTRWVVVKSSVPLPVETPSRTATVAFISSKATGSGGVANSASANTNAFATYGGTESIVDPSSSGIASIVNANKVTIVPGNYLLKGSCSFYGTNYTRLRLYNHTTNQDIKNGQNIRVDSSGADAHLCTIEWPFSCSVATEISLDYWCESVGLLGINYPIGTTEYGPELIIMKLG